MQDAEDETKGQNDRAEPSAIDRPRRLPIGTFSLARTREGADHFNTLVVGPRFVFSA